MAMEERIKTKEIAAKIQIEKGKVRKTWLINRLTIDATNNIGWYLPLRKKK